uniref:Metalloendopeptidase n=1 Tax=Trichuris muris TaxID=70415 RepID=A0A5S6QZ76_TRIMR
MHHWPKQTPVYSKAYRRVIKDNIAGYNQPFPKAGKMVTAPFAASLAFLLWAHLTVIDGFQINLNFLTPEDFRNGIKIAARDIIVKGVRSIWEINKFRGDIVGKAKRRKQQSPSSYGNVARSGRTGNAYRWPNGRIPYELSSSYSSYERAIIARAMQSYHERTCIRFVGRTNEVDYLAIGKYDGCFSDVGRSGGRQLLSLDDGCVIYRTVLHELMHSVGFWHEHERQDRDNYVEIIWRNIRPGAHSQFNKVDPSESNTYGESYDYRSIMHYDSKSFSRNGRDTMVARQPGMTSVMGKSPDFSPSDLRKINNMYKCNGGGSHVGRPVNPPLPRPVPPVIHPEVNDGYGDDYDGSMIRPRPVRPGMNLRIKIPFMESFCRDFGPDCHRWAAMCNKPFIGIPMKFACAKTIVGERFNKADLNWFIVKGIHTETPYELCSRTPVVKTPLRGFKLTKQRCT